MRQIQVTASASQGGDWFVAQCLEYDVASQGRSVEVALDNLREALELHFEPPTAAVVPELHKLGVEVSAA